MTIEKNLLLTISGAAVLMDLQTMQIENGWIICSLLASGIWTFFEKGLRGMPMFFLGALLPLVMVGWLFLFRMLGPGDIKLFCALGGIMGPAGITKCVFFSFLNGALLAFAILFFYGDFRRRFQYLFNYIKEYARTGVKRPYYKPGRALENIHFTVPIFMSILLYVGGIY